jgi:hypothetical protein
MIHFSCIFPGFSIVMTFQCQYEMLGSCSYYLA